MEIIVGSYDEVILGFRLVIVGEECQIETSFSDNSHTGCLKCMAVSPRGILASGGTDESIRLLDIKRNRELGSLLHHNGTITGLQFYKGFMFSASEDKRMCLWRTNNWECMRTFKGHKSAINSISIHPSGKLALTVGRDKTMHTWNLMTGRCAYVTNLKQVADLVCWSTDGDTYAVVINNKIDIYSVEVSSDGFYSFQKSSAAELSKPVTMREWVKATASVKKSYQAEGRINCIDYFKNDTIVYGGEGSKCIIQNLDEDTPAIELDLDITRLKGMCISLSPLEDDPASCKLLTMASSEGKLFVYKLKDNLNGISSTLLAEHSTNFRLTCLTVFTKKPRQTVSEKDSGIEEEELANNSESEQSSENEDNTPQKDNKKKNKKRKSAEADSEVVIKKKKQNKKDGDSNVDSEVPLKKMKKAKKMQKKKKA